MSDIVEAVSAEQIEQVRSLFREYQTQVPQQYRAPAHETEASGLPGDYGPPEGKLLLATVAGQPVGCVGLRSFPLQGTCEMKHLYVRPTFRGGNVGRKLVERVVQEAGGMGYQRMRLDTHPPTMQTALAMYRKFGFREVAPGPLDPMAGLLYMELLLTATPREAEASSASVPRRHSRRP